MGEIVNRSAVSASSRFSIILIFLAPALMALLPWDFGDDMTPYRALMKGNSLPVTLVELAIIIAGMQKNISPVLAMTRAPMSSIIAVCLLLFLITYTTCFIAAEPASAALGILTLLVHLLFALTASMWAGKCDTRIRRTICNAIGWGVALYCLIWFAAIIVQWPTEEEWVSNVPGMPNVRGIGFFAVAAYFAGIGSLPNTAVTTDNKFSDYMQALLLGTLGLGLAIWTGSRGSLVAIIMASFVLIVCSKKWRTKLMAYALVSALLAGIATYPLPYENPSYGMNRMMESRADNSSGRIVLWKETFEKVAQRPLTGWGIDQFKISGPLITLGLKQPHNIFLQTLFSVGLIGTILALIAGLPLFRKLRWRDSDAPTVAAWGCLAATCVFGLYDAAFYYAFPVMVMLISCAAIIQPPPSATDK
jgi:O-antigen ligase